MRTRRVSRGMESRCTQGRSSDVSAAMLKCSPKYHQKDADYFLPAGILFVAVWMCRRSPVAR